MTHIQRAWTIAAVLAGALFVCALGLLATALGADDAAGLFMLMLAFVAAVFGLFVFAARNARRP